MPMSSATATGGSGSFFRRLSPFLGARLWPRLRRRLPNCRLFDETGVAKKSRDAIGRQRADAEPMLNPFGLQCDPIGVRAIEHRVVGPEFLDKATVARTARIRDNDTVIGSLFRTTPRQADLQ